MNSDDVQSLLLENIDKLEDMLKFNGIQPDDLFKYGFYSVLIFMINNRDSADEITNLEELNFNELKKLVPNIQDCLLKIISYHYGTICMLVKNDDFSDIFDTWKTICFISHLNGFLFSHLLSSKLTNNNVNQKEFYSKIGKKGGDAKNRPFSELKKWVIEKAKYTHGDDVGVSRKLASNIPNHLRGISKNPERLIYDLIREFRKNN
jgi:hypothetical protein